MAKSFLTNTIKKTGVHFDHFIEKFFKLEFLLIFSTIIASLIIRFFAIPFISGDFTTFLRPWIEEFRELGLNNAFGIKIADYFYPYLYIIGFLSIFPIYDLYIIKSVSILFDYLLGFLVYKIIKRSTKNTYKSIIAGISFLFLPTVISNGALWGQVDIIYSFFAVLAVYLFIKKKEYLGTLAFAVSFCFKLQAIFILPAIILFLFKSGKKKLLNLILIPLVYLSFSIPAVIQGRSLIDILTIYGTQATQYEGINLGGYGFYSLFNGNSRFGSTVYELRSLSGDDVIFNFTVERLIGIIGTFTALGIVSIIFFSLVKYIKRLTPNLMISISLGFAFIIPYLLPRMHERYWFLADVLSFIYVFINPKKWYIALIINLSSFFAYFGFLFRNQISEIIPLKWLPLISIIPIYYIFKDISQQIISININSKKVDNPKYI